jgi:hypothetical protein
MLGAVLALGITRITIWVRAGPIEARPRAEVVVIGGGR